MNRVLSALSGGIDSAVATFLLKQQGYSVVAVTLQLLPRSWDRLGMAAEDDSRAAQVAASLGVEHHIIDLRDSFEAAVIRPFVEEYENGFTPNPCILCNRYLKFAALYDIAKKIGCSHIATGHYARIELAASGRYLLKKACDRKKDQSYVLYSLTQEQLSRTLFPLGELSKEEVRRLAKAAHLPNYEQAESQDICFVPDGDYVGFLERYRQKTYPPGNFVNLQGEILGQHRGLVAYTVGQRKGLGLSHSAPLYVKKINPVDNTILVCEKSQLTIRGLLADRFRLIALDSIPPGTIWLSKTRYQQAERPALLEQITAHTVRLVFQEASPPVAPGQAVVLYDGDYVMGGGRIIESF